MVSFLFQLNESLLRSFASERFGSEISEITSIPCENGVVANTENTLNRGVK